MSPTTKAKATKGKPGKAKPAANGGQGAEPADGTGWIDAGDGYQLTLEGGSLVCRNPKGVRLASVPKVVREGEASEGLLALRDWLAQHERECAGSVESWMLRSLEVPRSVLVAVWPDAAWRTPLENAVVWPIGADGAPVHDHAGFLRGIDPERGVGIVDLDGETRWLDASLIGIPHPILLGELDGFRELATQLALSQGIQQLHRETWARSGEETSARSSISQFSDGKFAMLVHAHGRAKSLGYRVRGGFACCSVWEGSDVVEARYWIGADSPDVETWTGDLTWVDSREQGRPLEQIGPVAYSEGMRMASAIWAGRVVVKEDAS